MDTDIYNCTIIVVARVLALTHLDKDFFEDVRWFVIIIVILRVIIRAITGTCPTCGDITTTKSG